MSAALLFQSIPVQAGTIEILQNKVASNFPYNITFFLDTKTSDPIEAVWLVYGISSSACLQSHAREAVTIAPERPTRAQWTWELAGDELAPGVEIWWQWEIRDRAGNTLVSEVQRERIQDDRFDWRTMQRGPVTLQWAEGSQAFANELVAIAEGALRRLQEDAGISFSGTIHLIVYPSTDAMLEVLVYAPQWAGGLALPEYNVILTGIGPEETGWASQVIPHELAHLITDRRVSGCGDNQLPTWLGEGLAEFVLGPTPDIIRNSIQTVLEHDRLPSLSSLSEGFSSNSRLADQSYYQSRIVVEFMIETYGPEKMDALLNRVSEGITIDQALQQVYGLDTHGLDQTWRASQGVSPDPEEPAAPEEPGAPPLPPAMLLFMPEDWLAATPTAAPTHTPEASRPTAAPTTTHQPPAAQTTAAATPTAPAPISPAQGSKELPLLPYILAGISLAAVLGGVGILVIKKGRP